MSKQISITLPDGLVRKAERLAAHSGQDFSDVITEAIEASLDPLGFSEAGLQPVENWTDGEVVAAAEALMEPAADKRLLELLDRQQNDLLTSGEREELNTLMRTYGEGSLNKAQGLREAVRRRLLPAPPP